MICSRRANTTPSATRKDPKNPGIASRQGKWKRNVAAEMGNTEDFWSILGPVDSTILTTRDLAFG